MRARRTSLVWGLAIVSFVLSGLPFALAADSESERMTELLAVSGNRAALPHLVDSFAQGATAALSTVAEPEDIRKIVARTITADRVFDRLVAAATRGFDAERVSRLLVWMRTPLVQRISQMELQGFTASEAEIAAYTAQPDNAPDPRRGPLFERLEAAMHATEMNVQLALALQRGFARGALPPSAPLPPGLVNETATRALVDAERPRIVAQQRYMYRELTTEEFAAYVEMLERDDQQWFGRTVRNALVEAIESVCEDAARETFGSARPRPPAERT